MSETLEGQKVNELEFVRFKNFNGEKVWASLDLGIPDLATAFLTPEDPNIPVDNSNLHREIANCPNEDFVYWASSGFRGGIGEGLLSFSWYGDKTHLSPEYLIGKVVTGFMRYASEKDIYEIGKFGAAEFRQEPLSSEVEDRTKVVQDVTEDVAKFESDLLELIAHGSN